MSRLVPILLLCAACHPAKQPSNARLPPLPPESRLRVVLLPLEGGDNPEALSAKLCSELQRFERAILTCAGDLRATLQHTELQMLLGSCDAACFDRLGLELKADRFVRIRIDTLDEAAIVAANVIGVDGQVLATALVQAGGSSAEALLAAMSALAEKIVSSL